MAEAKNPSIPKTLPTTEKILYVFSGAARRCDVAHFVSEEATRHHKIFEVVEIDLLRGGSDHDMSNDKVAEAILARINNHEFIALMAAPPCNTHSRAAYSGLHGPKPVRSRNIHMGFQVFRQLSSGKWTSQTSSSR